MRVLRTFCPELPDELEHGLSRPILDDGLLVLEVVGRMPAVRTRARRQECAREQIVDRHVSEARDRVRELRGYVARSAQYLADAVRLHTERVGERLPSADLVAKEAQRGAHVALLLVRELHGFTTVSLGARSISIPNSSIAWTMPIERHEGVYGQRQAGRAHAEMRPSDQVEISDDLAMDGIFTPLIVRADGRSRGVATISWARASTSTSLDLRIDVAIWRTFRVVADVSMLEARGETTRRPSLGVATQVLTEQRHTIDLSTYLAYKSEGFTEPEGEIELVVSFGKRLGFVRATVNAAYGQDVEAVDRDAEVAIALHVEPTRGLFAGAVSRYRSAIGSSIEPITAEFIAAATATIMLRRRLGLTLSAGITRTKTSDPATTTGPVGVLTFGTLL